MYFVINYKEYCEVMGETYDKDNIPAWFTRVQKTAIQAIRKEITDTSIFPVNNAMLHQLKKRWLPQVIEGIAKQIFYTYNNEYFLNNGVFANRSYSQTQYGEGPVNREDYLNAVNTICTPAQNALLGTGWLCKKANIVFDKDKYYINYNPTYKDVNWGQIGGVIEEQTDLMDYLADNYTAINDFLTFKTSTNTSITNLETNIESVEEVAESKQEALSGLSTYAAGRYLKVVNNGTTDEQDLEIQWVDLGSIVQENLIQWDDATKELFKGETGKYTIVDDIKLKGAEKTIGELIDSKSEVEVSTQKVSGAADIYSINVDGTDYNLPNSGSEMTVDTEMSDTSTNAVQNKTIKAYADNIKNAIPTKTSQLTNDSGYAKTSDIPTKTSSLTNDGDGTNPFLTKTTTALENYYTSTEVDQKIATGTGLYLGWLENDAEELPSESEIGTWIINNWSSLKPESVEQVTNNDYVYIYFSTKYLYWRVKVVTESTGKVTPSEATWKKDLEFNDDIIGLVEQVNQNTKDIATLDSSKVSKSGDTISGNLTIEKTSPEVIFNGTSETNYGGFTWKQQGTIKYQCRYNSNLGIVYFQDTDSNTMRVPTGAGTLAKTSDIPTDYVNTTSDQDVGGTKNFTSGRVCLGDSDRAIVYDSNDKTFFVKNNEGYLLFPEANGTFALTSDIPETPTLYVETTYSELVTLRDSGKLNAGCWYRITDYVATTTQTNTQATSNQYDIIVLATSTNTLSEEARAIQHSGDTYFANSNLNAWKVWYCLDNDTNRFAWADSTNGKGIVYHLIDEVDNSVWYDFKLIQVKNFKKSDRFYYLFDNEGVDASLNTSTTIDCYSNHFGNYIASNKYRIGCNIFYGGNDFSKNTIGNSFYKNTIGNSFYSNTIGNYFNSNTIGNDFYCNIIGNDFYSNIIGNDFYSNTIGNIFCNNDLSAITTQPTYCSFPSGANSKITTSTTSLDSKRTYYLGSDGSLKSLS